jgi:hypothetical protein
MYSILLSVIILYGIWRIYSAYIAIRFQEMGDGRALDTKSGQKMGSIIPEKNAPATEIAGFTKEAYGAGEKSRPSGFGLGRYHGKINR